MAALDDLVPISLVVVALLAIVTASYRQTLYAYPNGGGSYIVSRENLGTGPSLVAAAALMVDYTLTVSVSIAAGVAAITSAVVPSRGHEVPLGSRCWVSSCWQTCAGVRESGRLFAPPTYLYVTMMTLLVVSGLIGVATGDLGRLHVDHPSSGSLHGWRCRARGCFVVPVAPHVLVGSGRAERCRGDLERSPGIPAAHVPERGDHLDVGDDDPRQPVPRYRRATPSTCDRRSAPTRRSCRPWAARSLDGAALLAAAGVDRHDPHTVGEHCLRRLPAPLRHRRDRRLPPAPALEPRRPSGPVERGPRPRRRSGCPPRRVRRRCACPRSAVRSGSLHRVHAVRRPAWWCTIGESGSRGGGRRLTINGVGTAATSVVAVVVVVSKFTEGAWIPTVVIPLLVALFWAISRHYGGSTSRSRACGYALARDRPHRCAVLVGDRIHAGSRGTRVPRSRCNPATSARSMSRSTLRRPTRCRRVGPPTGSTSPSASSDLRIEELHPTRAAVWSRNSTRDEVVSIVTVVVPEFVVHHWSCRLLRDQKGRCSSEKVALPQRHGGGRRLHGTWTDQRPGRRAYPGRTRGKARTALAGFARRRPV